MKKTSSARCLTKDEFTLVINRSDQAISTARQGTSGAAVFSGI
jgi:hypothetical protein